MLPPVDEIVNAMRVQKQNIQSQKRWKILRCRAQHIGKQHSCCRCAALQARQVFRGKIAYGAGRVAGGLRLLCSNDADKSLCLSSR